ncbi:MAG: hypothetical protein LBQ88_06925 [Treponema sp.]|nr:hypothetical protein [Treponema sp.]
MENIKNVCKEVETVLMDMWSKGIKEIDNALVTGRLENLIFKAHNLKMETGKYLIKEFILKYKKFKESDKVSDREIKEMAKSLMALDFYIKNIIYYEDKSEL